MYELKFTEQEMQWIEMALGELPFKFASPLVQSINRQIAEGRRVPTAADQGKPEAGADGRA